MVRKELGFGLRALKRFRPFARNLYVARVRLLGRQAEIHAERDRKLEQARRLRQLRRKQVVTFPDSPITMTSPGETEAGYAGRQPC